MLVQSLPLHEVQRTEQTKPTLLQLQRLPQPVLQPQLMSFASFSGTGSLSEHTGINPSSFFCHPQSQGSRAVFPLHY